MTGTAQPGEDEGWLRIVLLDVARFLYFVAAVR